MFSLLPSPFFRTENPPVRTSTVTAGLTTAPKSARLRTDWKTQKPFCPPYVIRESPGKGRGHFATRRIKEGQVLPCPVQILQSRSCEESKTRSKD